MTASGDREQPPFLRSALRANARRRDLVILAVPAVAMVGIYLLPTATRRSLGFAYTEPTIITAYTAHFVHFDLAHLLGNLVVYILIASTLYVLCVLADHRDLWLVFFLTVWLGFPFVLSGLNLAIERVAVSIGASGLTTALLGGIPMALAVLFDQRAPGPFARRYAPVFFLPTLLVIVLVGVPGGTLTRVALLGIIGLSGLYSRSLFRQYGWPDRTAVSWIIATPGYAELLAVTGILLIGYPAVLFTGGSVGTTIPNHYIHLLGYCLAFLVSFIADQADIVAA